MPNHRYLNESKGISLKADYRPRYPQPPQHPPQSSKWLEWALAAIWEPANQEVHVIHQFRTSFLFQTSILITATPYP